MSKINEEKDNTMLNREEKEFAELFYEALKTEGLGIPTTIAEVQHAVTEGLETDISDLPTWMQDPAEVLRQSRKFSLKLVPLPSTIDKINVLFRTKRAARLGGIISDEVNEKMKSDRKKSEKGARNLEDK